MDSFLKDLVCVHSPVSEEIMNFDLPAGAADVMVTVMVTSEAWLMVIMVGVMVSCKK